jgi:hypothetical protein
MNDVRLMQTIVAFCLKMHMGYFVYRESKGESLDCIVLNHIGFIAE